MFVFAALLGFIQSAALVILLAITQPHINPPEGLWMICVVWIVISFGPLCYVWAQSRKALPYANVALISLLVISVIGGLAPGNWRILPFHHQFCISGAATALLTFAFINYFQGRLSTDSSKSLRAWLLGLSPTLGIISWSFLNIAIVSSLAARESEGQDHCILRYQTPLQGIGTYVQVKAPWELYGFALITPYTNDGGTDDFQFGFHAILLAPNKIMNWSYQTQSFMSISPEARDNLHLYTLRCEGS